MDLRKDATRVRKERVVWTRDKLLKEQAVAIGSSIAPSSHKAYNFAFRSYQNFCHLHGLETTPTPETVSFFIVYNSHYVSPRSTKSYLSGIFHCFENDYPEVRKLNSHPLVKKTLAGCLRTRSSPVRRKRPLTAKEIERVVNSIKRGFLRKSQMLTY